MSSRPEGGDGARTPLKPAVFHILLALAEGELHGLGIAAEVGRLTGGEIRLGPGTLYRSLKQMSLQGLVQEAKPPDDDADPRRKYYTITEDGRAVLESEAERFARIVGVARDRNVFTEGRS